MSDLVSDLRKVERAGDLSPRGHPTLAKRAADEIERLTEMHRDMCRVNGDLVGALEAVRDRLVRTDDGYSALTVVRDAWSIANSVLNQPAHESCATQISTNGERL